MNPKPAPDQLEEVGKLARTLYPANASGAVRMRELPSYCDRNVRIDGNGRCMVLKIYSPAQGSAAIELEDARCKLCCVPNRVSRRHIRSQRATEPTSPPAKTL